MKKTIKQIIIEEKRAYGKKWRDANPDKVKKHQDDFWLRKAGKRLEEMQQGKDK